MEAVQASEDAEQLKVLSIFHYVMAALLVVTGCIAAAYFAFTGFMVTEMFKAMPPSAAGPPPPRELGWIFGGIGALLAVGSVVIATFHFMCGRWLAARRNRSFCFVVACICCVFVPLGTILGIFTIVVLNRPSVRALFDRLTPGAYLNR
jgi:hypothetical protein